MKKKKLQGGPVPIESRVITSFLGVTSPQLPIWKAISRGPITYNSIYNDRLRGHLVARNLESQAKPERFCWGKLWHHPVDGNQKSGEKTTWDAAKTCRK